MTEPNAAQLDRSGLAGASSALPGTPGPKSFYRYRSAEGRTVIVDSLSEVPMSERTHVERVQFDAPATLSAEARALQVHWPSFATGFGVALVLATVVLFVARGSVRWLAFLLVLAVLVGGSGAYFGWLRRTTGQGTTVFASPSALINDAQRAVEKMKQHNQEQDRVIREIQREAK